MLSFWSSQVAVCNGKPTIIDFYADWCESCKVMAPSMRSVETQYKDRINFISVDGSNSKNGEFWATPRFSRSRSMSLITSFLFTADLVKMFRVDGIPHLAFIGSDQEVKTALVGSVPKPILKDQITALLQVPVQFCSKILHPFVSKLSSWVFNLISLRHDRASRCLMKAMTRSKKSRISRSQISRKAVLSGHENCVSTSLNSFSKSVTLAI